jgi:hypothetical protein
VVEVAFGVSLNGFDIKPFGTILEESFARARTVFADPDLTPTSALRKVLEVTAAEDAELWKRMEALYYANFISTATGASLDRIGEDLGLLRSHRFAIGAVRLTLAGGAPGRTYLVPEGAVLRTAGPSPVWFFTVAAVELSATTPQAEVAVQAFESGPQGDVAANTITVADPEYVAAHLRLGAATLQVTNPAALTGGGALETDEPYRSRLLGRPRSLWTLESVRRGVQDLPGVLDVLVDDSLGGVDVSQSYFDLFNFGERLFSAARRLGEPYFFDVVVAHEPARPWRTEHGVRGIYERVKEAIDALRPPGIHANIVQADHIEVGVRAQLTVDAGHDEHALVTGAKDRLARDIGSLRLGGAVLFSQTLRAFVDQPGVVDVQDLHLRRCPAAFGRTSFGGAPFQREVVETPVGENLRMGRQEIAIFRIDSELIQIEVASR